MPGPFLQLHYDMPRKVYTFRESGVSQIIFDFLQFQHDFRSFWDKKGIFEGENPSVTGGGQHRGCGHSGIYSLNENRPDPVILSRATLLTLQITVPRALIAN